MIVHSHKYFLNLLTIFSGLPLLQLIHVRLTSKLLFVEFFTIHYSYERLLFSINVQFEYNNIRPWCPNTTLDSFRDEYQTWTSADGIAGWISCKACAKVWMVQLDLWISKLKGVRGKHTCMSEEYISHNLSFGSWKLREHLQRIQLASMVPTHLAFCISYKVRTPAWLNL